MELFVEKPAKQPKLVWSLQATSIFFLLLLCVSLFTALYFGNKPLWIEFEVVVLVFGFFLFCFYTLALYRGIAFKHLRIKSPTLSTEHVSFLKIDKWLDSGRPIYDSNFFTEMGADSGMLAAIAGFIIDCLISIFLSLLITGLVWIGLNAIISGSLFIFVPLYYLFKRSTLVLLRHARRCNGQLLVSLSFAFAYAFSYSTIFLGAIYLIHKIMRYSH
jgi:hypothetical protein